MSKTLLYFLLLGESKKINHAANCSYKKWRCKLQFMSKRLANAIDNFWYHKPNLAYVVVPPVPQNDHHGHRAGHLSGLGSAAGYQVHLLWAGWDGVNVVLEEPHYNVKPCPDTTSGHWDLLQEGALCPAALGPDRGCHRTCQQGRQRCVCAKYLRIHLKVEKQSTITW